MNKNKIICNENKKDWLNSHSSKFIVKKKSDNIFNYNLSNNQNFDDKQNEKSYISEKNNISFLQNFEQYEKNKRINLYTETNSKTSYDENEIKNINSEILITENPRFKNNFEKNKFGYPNTDKFGSKTDFKNNSKHDNNTTNNSYIRSKSGKIIKFSKESNINNNKRICEEKLNPEILNNLHLENNKNFTQNKKSKKFLK